MWLENLESRSKMKLDGTTLFKKVQEQWAESNNKLQSRLPEWMYVLDAWRGQFRDEQYYNKFPRDNATAYDKFPTGSLSNYLTSSDRLQRKNQEFEIYPRLIFRMTETLLARLDRAYLTQSRPFQLKMPVVLTRPIEDIEAYKDALSALEKWQCFEFRRQRAPEVLIRSLRDAILMDYGICGVKQDFKGPYPVAKIFRSLPWNVYGDPYSAQIPDGEFVMFREEVKEYDALKAWPESEKEIKGALIDEKGRKYIQTIHYTGWLGEESGDVDLPEGKLCDIVFLGNKDGEPSGVVLDAWENPWQKITLVDFKMVHDSEELGPNGTSFASTITDDQEAQIILFNRAIEKFEYSTLQGGFYDSAFAGEFGGGVLTTPRPGEYKPIPANRAELSHILMPLEFPDFTPQHLQLIDRINLEASRKTAVNDYNAGISTPTDSGTLGETNMLMGESNEVFRAKAQRLDTAFQRLYQMFVLLQGDALLRWHEAGKYKEPIVVMCDDQPYPIDPTLFDNEFEVNVAAGAQYIDGPKQAMKLLLYVEKFGAMGLIDPEVAMRAARKIMSLDNLDPDDILPTLKEIAERAAQAQAMQAVVGAVAGAAGIPPSPQLLSSGGQAEAPPPSDAGGVA